MEWGAMREAKMPVYKGERDYLRQSEIEVVRRRSHGLTPAEIAEDMTLSLKTVEAHLNAARKALNCRTSQHLTAEYVRRYERT